MASVSSSSPVHERSRPAEHRHRVEEVEADHSLGMIKVCCHLVTDSDEVFVASRQLAETCFSRSAKTCFLIDISSKTASMTKSQSAKSTSSVVPEISPRSRFASSGDPFLTQQPVDLGGYGPNLFRPALDRDR